MESRYPVVADKWDGDFPDRVELRLPPGMRYELQQLARAKGQPMSVELRQALVAHLDSQKVPAGA